MCVESFLTDPDQRKATTGLILSVVFHVGTFLKLFDQTPNSTVLRILLSDGYLKRYLARTGIEPATLALLAPRSNQLS